WDCIYGRGCPGVLTGPAADLDQGCCSYGAHFTGDADRARVEARIAQLGPDEWQFHDEATALGGGLHVDAEGGTVTHQAEDACIMLNRPGHPAGAGCALHQAAVARGERPLDWKPEVCWQLPLRLVDHMDEHGHVTSTLREWKRRDWGDGGREFHWWCTEDPLAFVGPRPVVEALRDEIVELVGQAAYDQLVRALADRRDGRRVPHPARRARSEPLDASQP
ncbi:MAG TPA: hypothetical protein PKA98_14735, partial [Acidimicrobiales bacterium]|nr:hypothetical protein [Acidimicrobiales bacterium]